MYERRSADALLILLELRRSCCIPGRCVGRRFSNGIRRIGRIVRTSPLVTLKLPSAAQNCVNGASASPQPWFCARCRLLQAGGILKSRFRNLNSNSVAPRRANDHLSTRRRPSNSDRHRLLELEALA
jgi:hypothetical protein